MFEGKADDKSNKLKETDSEAKPAGRRGRRSVQTGTKTVEESKVKPGRKSLPAVLETADSNKDGASTSVNVTEGVVSVTADKEEKTVKGRKGRNAKQTKKDLDQPKTDKLTESAGSVDESAPKRSTRRGVSNDLVTEKVEANVPEASDSGTGSTRQSSRSKSKKTEAEKSVEPEVSRTKAAEKIAESEESVKPSRTKVARTTVENTTKDIDKNKQSIEIQERPHRTRNKETSDSQDSVETSKRSARKTGKLSEINNAKVASNGLQEKGPKHESISGNSKSNSKQSVELVPETSVNTAKEEAASDRPSRASRKRGKGSESQESQTIETKKSDSKTSEKDSETKQKRTSYRRGRTDSVDSESQSGKNVTNGDSKENTNVKNHVQQDKLKEKDSKGGDKSKEVQKASKTKETTGKVTRGKLAGPSNGAGDAHQVWFLS